VIESLKQWFKSLGAPAPAPQPPPAAPAPQPTGAGLNILYDQQTAQIIQRVLAPDSSCVDVGCHEGSILDEMLKSAPRAVHYAFEPLPHLFAGLQAKYGGNPNVNLHELALSEAPGEATFQHVVSNPGYSGLLRRRFDRPHEDVVEIKVKLARLDDILPPEAQIRLMKVDVEGAELQVLRGATGMLARCRPFVVFEHGQGAADVYGTRPEHLYDLFSQCGLRVSLLGDWLATNGGKTLAREDFVREFDQVSNYYFLAHA
jgi:FkbM family methyltransferase